MTKTSYLTILLLSCCYWSCQVDFSALQHSLDQQYTHYNTADFCRFSADKQDKARERMLAHYQAYYEKNCTHADSIANWNNLGVRLAQQGSYAKAQQQLQKALVAEDHPTVRYNLAMTYFLAAQPDSAHRQMQLLSATDDVFHTTHNSLVAELTTEHNLQWPSVSAPVEDFRSRYQLTNSFLPVNAMATTDAASAASCNCQAAQRKGILAWQDSSFTTAADHFAQAMRQDFCENENRLNYAMALWKMDEAEAAKAYLQEMTSPWRAEKYYALGLMHYQLQEWRQAKANFKRAARVGQNWVRGHVGAGNVCIVQGDYAEGQAHFSRALQSDPTDHAALLGKAICIYEYTKNEFNYFTPYQLRECVELLQQIDPAETNPQIVFQTNVLLAYALLKESLFGGSLQNQQYQAILASFRKALDLQPHHVPCLVGMALTEHQLGKHSTAQRYLDEAIASEADNPHLYNIKASLLYNQKEHRGARQNYYRAYQLDSTNLEALNGLGITNRKLLAYAPSIKYLQKVVDLSKRHVYHDKYLNNLGLSRYYYAQELENKYLTDSSQHMLDSATYAYQQAIDEMYTAFALQNDSTFLFNIGTVVSDSCIGRFQDDSIVRSFYLLGGRENGRYISNNLGVLYALRDSHRLAKEHFTNAIIPEDKRYATPLWNLERLGEKMSPRQVRAMTVAQRHSSRFQHQRDGFIYTLIYHYNYLYRFELYDKLLNETEPILLDVAPDMIYEFRFMECSTQKEKRKPKKSAYVKGKRKKPVKYNGACPAFN